MSETSSYIAHLRQDYSLAALDEITAGDDPMAFFQFWFDEAHTARISEVNAMTLATVGIDGMPHARIVLLKGVENGTFTFFTNYESAKGIELQAHPQVALLFFWKELERQVRIEGVARPLTAEANDLYFHSRPVGSRIGAWSSPQSQPIEGRHVIEANYSRFEAEFANGAPPRPAHWGGYAVMPHSMEFWQGRSNRLHDRIRFSQENGIWKKSRLAP